MNTNKNNEENLEQNNSNDFETSPTREEQLSFDTAEYIVNKYGNDISNEKLIKAAKELNIPEESLIEDYKYIVTINKIFDECGNDGK
ncbi:hypothetical protein CMT56_18105 [Elizabethkingia anophelis]|nr:hypothetical protein [Elizabethkingia anophelis]MDV3863427.1 hypothetical protein [Elizabethkingia anophelis]MDV3910599.1 hypothetical protein [Elizabethkingia anophelis]MDV3925293.1 hypothetical protein [Elizabethkingia anophelis]MDV3989926.1 hypothetical protein [Elizabethkingia anophelis]